MGKQQMRQTRTEDYLAQAFWALYARKPIRQITVKELTEKAGVHRSSFYGHFEDIYDLFRQEQEKLLAGIEAYVRAACQEQEEGVSLEEILGYYRENLSKLSALCGEHGDAGFQLGLRARIIPEIMAHLKIPAEDKEAYYILDFILNGMLSFLTTWYQREGGMPPTQTLAAIRETLIHGSKATVFSHSAEPQRIEWFLHARWEG